MFKYIVATFLVVIASITHAEVVTNQCDADGGWSSLYGGVNIQVDSVSGEVRLTGNLGTPSSNYGYTLENTELNAETQYMNMVIDNHGGMGIAMVDTMAINSVITLPEDVTTIIITVSKRYNWGPKQITCTLP